MKSIKFDKMADTPGVKVKYHGVFFNFFYLYRFQRTNNNLAVKTVTNIESKEKTTISKLTKHQHNDV